MNSNISTRLRTLGEQALQLAADLDALARESAIGSAAEVRVKVRKQRVGRSASLPRAACRWNSEETEVLRSHFKDGKTIPQISALMGRTIPAIGGKLSKIGLTL